MHDDPLHMYVLSNWEMIYMALFADLVHQW